MRTIVLLIVLAIVILFALYFKREVKASLNVPGANFSLEAGDKP